MSTDTQHTPQPVVRWPMARLDDAHSLWYAVQSDVTRRSVTFGWHRLSGSVIDPLLGAVVPSMYLVTAAEDGGAFVGTTYPLGFWYAGLDDLNGDAAHLRTLWGDASQNLPGVAIAHWATNVGGTGSVPYPGRDQMLSLVQDYWTDDVWTRIDAVLVRANSLSRTRHSLPWVEGLTHRDPRQVDHANFLWNVFDWSLRFLLNPEWSGLGPTQRRVLSVREFARLANVANPPGVPAGYRIHTFTSGVCVSLPCMVDAALWVPEPAPTTP